MGQKETERDFGKSSTFSSSETKGMVDDEEAQPRADDESSNDVYASETPLTWLFGDHPEVKIVAAILSEPSRRLNKSDIAQLAGVSRTSVHENIEELVRLGVMEEVEEVGHITLYRLADTDVVSLLDKLQEQLLGIRLESEGADSSRIPDDPVSEDDRPDGSKLEEPYAEGTPLTLLFGDHPEPKIVAALISELETRLNVTDISRIAGVSRNAVYTHRDKFLQFELLEHAGKVGHSPQYEVVAENPAVELLRSLELALLVQIR